MFCGAVLESIILRRGQTDRIYKRGEYITRSDVTSFFSDVLVSSFLRVSVCVLGVSVVECLDKQLTTKTQRISRRHRAEFKTHLSQRIALTVAATLPAFADRHRNRAAPAPPARGETMSVVASHNGGHRAWFVRERFVDHVLRAGTQRRADSHVRPAHWNLPARLRRAACGLHQPGHS